MEPTLLLCLSLAVYYEARGEPADGQIAVAETVLNRAALQQKSGCDVVRERRQFEVPAHAFASPPDSRSIDWRLSKEFAALAVERRLEVLLSGRSPTEAARSGPSYFHAVSVCPYWTEQLKFTRQIGGHLFYRKAMQGERKGGPCAPKPRNRPTVP